MLTDLWPTFSELLLSIGYLFLMFLIIIAAAVTSQVIARCIDWLQAAKSESYLKNRALTPRHK